MNGARNGCEKDVRKDVDNFGGCDKTCTASPWPMPGVARYAGPINNTTALTWDIADCWNSASVAVALKRVGD